MLIHSLTSLWNVISSKDMLQQWCLAWCFSSFLSQRHVEEDIRINSYCMINLTFQLFIVAYCNYILSIFWGWKKKTTKKNTDTELKNTMLVKKVCERYAQSYRNTNIRFVFIVVSAKLVIQYISRKNWNNSKKPMAFYRRSSSKSFFLIRQSRINSTILFVSWTLNSTRKRCFLLWSQKNSFISPGTCFDDLFLYGSV